MTTITAQEAKDTLIWVVENQKVVNTNLYDFVMKSAEETTSPRGVERKLHIRRYQPESPSEVWNWGFRGQFPTLVRSFENDEQASDFIFQKTYESDFMQDDQRDTMYYLTRQDAENDLIDSIASRYNVSIPVAESISRRLAKLENLRDERKKTTELKAIENKNRIDNLAAEYACMITPIEGESYKETAARLRSAIGERIEGSVFHKAVKLIRR